jgi:signal transduction histidine kinase
VLEIVQRRGGQLREIIESLLFLARAEGPASLGEPERIEINDWCRSRLDAWTDHPRFGDITFRPSPSAIWITTHQALLGQIVDNLIDNACKYSDAGNQITISAECASDCVVIVVRDSGRGIPQDQLALIFEPFYRTPDSRWEGKAGVGLGLALVQRLALILGATVDVRSEVGQGSTFKVQLPITSGLPVTEDREYGSQEVAHSG